ALKNWKDSKYFNWYEWKKRPPSYPLPPGENAIDYYDCWWGFGLHPNLNYDLSRPNAQENGITKIEDADPNWDVVNYVLEAPEYWMGKMGVSGFRLDVPNEVPFWFWHLFREKCRKVKPDHILIGEIWGDATQWITPEVFDAVMNYRYFKDPVVKWIAQKKANAATFAQELAPGRTRYPIQAVRAQMNLIDSHDTERFLRVAGDDARRLRLAATFAMTYVGAPHIYYGDELGLTGGKDPDCRRTMPWSSMTTPARQQTLKHYEALTALRHEHEALSLGDFTTLLTQGQVFAYLRQLGEEHIVVVLNNGDSAASVTVPLGDAGISDGAKAEFLYGEGDAQKVTHGAVKVSVPGVDAVILNLE
ncbi:MAG TPA: alpha-amylase family glycosyl hydrolase, partial [Candidatus Krumholzibacteria bacterium]|nr:alpha-amylase family glycosyl hydrolase [Candidatus Krumholzibacteria bacterium]